MDQKASLWQSYYQNVENRGHRPLLATAITYDQTGLSTAIDCGCGTGNDVGFMLEQGYQVHAFDQQQGAVDICQRRFKKADQLTLSQASFETFHYPRASLIVAHSSLFFCDASLFATTWKKISTALVSGGVFCGDFLGEEDSWKPLPGRPLTPLARTEVEALFDGFKLVHCYERNEPGKTAIGNDKHWHTYSVVAQKN